jgi:hypothetical protein
VLSWSKYDPLFDKLKNKNKNKIQQQITNINSKKSSINLQNSYSAFYDSIENLTRNKNNPQANAYKKANMHGQDHICT